MESEAKIILAFLFNRSGKTALKESDMYLPLSMELGWFSTKEAHAFVKQAIDQGLLVKKDGVLEPTFAVGTVEIPVGFTPSKKVFSTEKPDAKRNDDVLGQIVSRICETTHRDATEVLNEVQQVEQEKYIVRDVAALLVARGYHVDVTEFFDTVEQRLFKGNTG